MKVSAFYLEKHKSFIPKKFFFKSLSKSKQKNFVCRLNFPGRFGSGELRAETADVEKIPQIITKKNPKKKVQHKALCSSTT